MATPLQKWVEDQALLTKPARIYWCDGSEDECRNFIQIGINDEKIAGNPVFHELNQKKWPNAYFHRSHPTDVARTEHLTYVCHENKELAGPNNNWMNPAEAKALMTKLSDGCMKGRTMYVMPYTMGHPDSPYSKACVQITDSAYVAVSMRIMTRMGKKAIEKIGAGENFAKGFHSIGDLDPNRRYIMHFPDEHFVWSIGSGYGGNALLGKKCFSLRIASWMGLKENWLAEHMVIMGIQDPQGNTTYVVAALPSACGKTNLAMLESALPGYKVRIIGDDIAWLNIGLDGCLRAINPEAGFFGVAPGTSEKTNPNMLKTLQENKFFPTLYTNTALDLDNNEPWWEGLTDNVPCNMLDWQGKSWEKTLGTKASHPNSRFTVSIYNCPSLSSEYDAPLGVPISAIIVGGRRSKLIPLVCEALSWPNGVFMASRIGSETTAAAITKEGVLRRDPFAMLPFCGYNMGNYFAHWLKMGNLLKNPPKIFSINWFRTDDNGKFIWPGFGDNIRVFKWIIDRINNKAGGNRTPIGILPNKEDMDFNGLNISQDKLNKLFEIIPGDWQAELADIEKFYTQFGDKIPQVLWDEYKNLAEGLGKYNTNIQQLF